MSISSIENFSNDLFYEIFEYLDGYEIFQAFSNLTHRFQQLLNSSSFLFKFNFNCSTINELHKQILLNNKHQILSFYIISSLETNEFFSSFTIDSSFDRLKSLVLHQIQPIIILLLLSKLTSLPRLFSLCIDLGWISSDLSEIYHLIFTLPKLKYIECSADGTTSCNLLPIATDEQFSIIEYFIINHSCTLKEFCTLISYTPEICHLCVMNLLKSYSMEEIILPISFPNLTYLSIEMAGISFDNLEEFIIETECNLKILRIDFVTDNRDYLDDDRWEELIINYLSELKKFHVSYYQPIDPESGCSMNFQPPEVFNSLFWNERKWILEVEMDSSDYFYSICPYKYIEMKFFLWINKFSSFRERWYDNNCSSERISNATRLILSDVPRDEYMIVLNLIIRDLLIVTQIYHLEISKKIICSSILMEFIHKLSALDTLKISSLELSLTRNSLIEEKNFRFLSNKNNITKVYIEIINEIEEVYFLVNLCRRMKYLKIDFINNMNYELLIKDILKKINNDCNQCLRLLCIHIPIADDEMIKRLEEMINREKLLRQFTIKRLTDNIYLEWK